VIRIVFIFLLSVAVAVIATVMRPVLSETLNASALPLDQMLRLLFKGCQIVWGGCLLSSIVVSVRRRSAWLPTLPHLCSLLGMFLAVLIIHFLGCKVSSSFDSRWTIHTAMSMITEGNTDLDEYQPLIAAEEYYAVQCVDHRLYMVYPVGTAFLIVPYVAALKHIVKRGLAIDLAQFISTTSPRGLEILIASTIVALTTVLIYLIGTLLLPKRRDALLLAFVFAFCTSAWSTASRALWQHGPSAFLLALVLYIFLLVKHRPGTPSRLIGLTGALLAFAYVIRPTNSLSILLFSLLAARQYRQQMLAFGGWALLVVIPFVAFNWSVYHRMLPMYYTAAHQLEIGWRMAEALIGTLFSPSRGLFIFTPVLLFAFYGLALKIRHKQMELLDYGLVAVLAAHWVITSAHPHWWGGHSYGPRYFTDVLPYFLYFLIPVLQQIPMLSGFRKRLVIWTLLVAIGISFGIHWRGATSWAVHHWNSTPVNVDDDPSRVWDWRDTQFLRGVGND